MPQVKFVKPPPVLPPGEYVARLRSVVEKTAKASGNPFFVWEFQVVKGEFKGSKASGNTPCDAYVGEGNKLSRWLSAFGITGKLDDRFDFEEIVGEKVRIITGTRTYSSAKSGQQGTAATVNDLVAYKHKD